MFRHLGIETPQNCICFGPNPHSHPILLCAVIMVLVWVVVKPGHLISVNFGFWTLIL